MMNDGEAISLCLKKRPEGYRALFERYSPFLLAVAFRMLKDRHLAEDALQETFSAAFAGLSRFRGEARLKTWLYTILYRAVLKLREKRKMEIPTDELPQAGNPGHANSVETRLAVKDVLDRLPERDRLVLVMSYWDDLSCQEIAEVMGVTANHVKILLFRARDRFSQAWPRAALELGVKQ